jgi:hypothetical protein
MNTEYPSPAQGKSFIPLVLVSLSVIFYFAWQLSEISKARENITNSTAQVDKYVNDNMPNYDAAVENAQKADKALSALAKDVIELSKTDDTAKKVMDNLLKVGIKFQTPDAAGVTAPAASPAASATPSSAVP